MDWRGELTPLSKKWDGETLYFYPMGSLEEAEAVFEALKVNIFRGQVELLVRRARKEDGARRFAPGARDNMMKDKDPNLVLALAREISDKSKAVVLEDAEKNY